MIGHYDEEFWADPLHDQREEANAWFDEREAPEPPDSDFGPEFTDRMDSMDQPVEEKVIIKATPDEAGCWIDGHWGWHAHVELINIAVTRGAELTTEDQYHLDRYAADGGSDSADYMLNQGGLCDWAEAWLNTHVAPDGYQFGWYEGEFFLSHIPDEHCADCGAELWWTDDVWVDETDGDCCPETNESHRIDEGSGDMVAEDGDRRGP